MRWYKVTLDEDQISSGAVLTIRDVFERIFLNSGAANGIALFADNLPLIDARRMKMYVSFYFSPHSFPYAVGLISAYAGTPCEKPSPDGVTLVVGQNDAQDLLK